MSVVAKYHVQPPVLLAIAPARQDSARRRSAKRTMDVVGALILLLLTCPIIILFCLGIRLDGGPALFRQKRVGRFGVPFYCYKLRTMRIDADAALAELLASDPTAHAEWQADFKLKDDPRITRIGRFLRKSSLDELPQLWNVLRGDMSLVGPRPIVPEEIEKYRRYFLHYQSVRPGLTGFWQVSGRNDVTYRRRVAMDTLYARRWSLRFDMLILMKTVKTITSLDGAY
jgi:Undecaprenyl-phosphate galactose phosphotransferase WbaP